MQLARLLFYSSHPASYFHDPLSSSPADDPDNDRFGLGLETVPGPVLHGADKNRNTRRGIERALTQKNPKTPAQAAK